VHEYGNIDLTKVYQIRKTKHKRPPTLKDSVISRQTLNRIRSFLSQISEVAFAYVHGSTLTSERPRDLDIAIFLYPGAYAKLSDKGEVHTGFAIPLEIEFEREMGKKVDIQILNEAPLSFRHRVVQQGVLVADNALSKRCHFEYLSRVQYFDFEPRRKEYLQEVLS
jgi:predicted nucleotidyltransferase